MTIELFFRLLGSLALLIYGMKTMSDALQKMAGPSLRHILGRMTGNRLSGMLTGTLVTCAVQSPSATTVMTVSFVSAGLLTLAQAISVIMGANIGTTLTAWIMSLGYNLDKKTATIDGNNINLTRTEFALLHLFGQPRESSLPSATDGFHLGRCHRNG